jgi:signal transduction histidine kinase
VTRLRRLRWLLTVLFTVMTGLCLLALVLFAAALDAQSRTSELDGEVNRVASALSRAVYYENGLLHLAPLAEDGLADGPSAVLVVEWGQDDRLSLRHTSSTASWLPPVESLRALCATVRRDDATVVRDGVGANGHTIRLAGAPVWNAEDIQGIVVAVSDPAPAQAAHDTLVRWLSLGAVGLLACAGLTGHALSGWSMRPALRGLAQQEQFLAEAAHELRTPLATLRLMTEAGPPDTRRLVDRMGRLVTGLLARARITAGTWEAERTPLRLDQVVEQVIEELSCDGITLDTRPTVVCGDPELLGQAVRNLLENAVAHGTAPGAPVRVEVTVAAGRVEIRDHGPGVTTDNRHKVSTGVSAGTGIGLAIVDWVAELHDGTARLRPAARGGTVAELVLPTA